MSRVLRIDAWFDFVCPWCLIGKRQLDQASVLLRGSDPQATLEVRWHGVQLLPDVPAEGWPFMEFYRRRLGSEAAVRQRQLMVLDEARLAGAAIEFASIRVMPNSADAHRLYAFACAAGTPAQADALFERLFAAHFCEGENIGSREVLLAAAAACGLEPGRARQVLQGGAHPFVADDGALAYPGAGVPCFVFDGRQLLCGAQSPGRLHDAMRQALAAG